MKQWIEKIKPYCPIPCMVLISLAPIAGILHLISRASVAFSDAMLAGVSIVPRFILAMLTNLLPFSLAEAILMASPILLILVIVVSIRLQKRELSASVRLISLLLSIISTAYFVFAVGFAPGYSGSTLEQRMKLDRKKVSAAELKQTAMILMAECETLLDEVEFLFDSASIMP